MQPHRVAVADAGPGAGGSIGARMERIEKPAQQGNPAMAWGSDPIAAILREAGFEYIALTPGASYRGLHDSLVNFLGNERPKMLLCIHEEHAVAIAHGYAKVTDKPMAVALHSNVGLMHATMAIFNAWCDRMPVFLLGANGPIDARRRRPWIDWIHTSRDLGGLIRGYVKWDDEPASVGAALEAILRARIIAQTAPCGPVFVCLDAGLQEESLASEPALPRVARFAPPLAAEPSGAAVVEAARLLRGTARPLIMVGRVSRDVKSWRQRVQLAERLGACVVTDLRTPASFPTRHRLHPYAPGMFPTEETLAAMRRADVILSLDWVDLGGALHQAWAGADPQTKIIQCSPDQYVHGGWSMDYQALPPCEVTLLATPDATVPLLLTALGKADAPAPRWLTPPVAPVTAPAIGGSPIPILDFASVVSEELAHHKPSYTHLPNGWPGSACDFAHPLDFLGYDGGGGLGGGPGQAVGAALALRESGRLPVCVTGDGDFLMGVTALWTAVHYEIPLLVIVANNLSFFNDELHQERVARQRSRPVENRWIGLRMADPPLDLAMLARGQGAQGHGPVDTVSKLATVLREAITEVRRGAVSVIDVRVAPEYDRAASSGVLRQSP